MSRRTQGTPDPAEQDTPVPVLFLVPALRVGGAERQLEALVRRLDRRRFAPVVACQHERGPVAAALEAAGIPVVQLSSSRRFEPRFFPRTLALVRRLGVRVVVTQGFSTGIAGRLAALLGGAPVRIVAEHATGERDMSPRKQRLNRLLMPCTSAWVAVAQAQVEYLTQVKKIPRPKIHVIHNGVDAAVYDLGARRAAVRSQLRAELGIPVAAPVAGSIAVLRPEKDLVTFVRAAPRVLQSLPEAHFVIAGDGPLRGELQREVNALGLAQRVRFAGWRDDIPELLAALDVAVLCSTDVETFPMAFLEAMAAELPLVGTRVGGLSEMIAVEENGLLVPPRQPDALAAALLRLLGDLETARRWGEASRQRVRHDYSVERMVSAYEGLFTALLAPRPAHALGAGNSSA